jgi:uncharacterized membrane protein YfcA
MIWLIPAFLITALLYASVGFGGGSTYTALLALGEVDYRILPAISLVCNVLVVTGGTIRFARAGLLEWRRALPLALVAAPFAWLGALTPISEHAFLTLLAICLGAAGLLLIAQGKDIARELLSGWQIKLRPLTFPIAAGLGYLAGLVGIGGGIFLAPFLHLTAWAKAKQVAATASLFILINSIAGLMAQSTKLYGSGQIGEFAGYWPLAIAVLFGGQIGSVLAIKRFPSRLIRIMTGLLTLFVAAQLLIRLYG